MDVKTEEKVELKKTEEEIDKEGFERYKKKYGLKMKVCDRVS